MDWIAAKLLGCSTLPTYILQFRRINYSDHNGSLSVRDMSESSYEKHHLLDVSMRFGARRRLVPDVFISFGFYVKVSISQLVFSSLRFAKSPIMNFDQ